MRTANVREPPPTNVGEQNEDEYVEFAVHQLQSTFECAKITIISLKGAIVNEKWRWRGVDQEGDPALLSERSETCAGTFTERKANVESAVVERDCRKRRT